MSPAPRRSSAARPPRAGSTRAAIPADSVAGTDHPEPAPAAARTPGLAPRALVRLPVLAGCTGARRGYRHGLDPLLGVLPDDRVRRRGGGRVRRADDVVPARTQAAPGGRR